MNLFERKPLTSSPCPPPNQFRPVWLILVAYLAGACAPGADTASPTPASRLAPSFAPAPRTTDDSTTTPAHEQGAEPEPGESPSSAAAEESPTPHAGILTATIEDPLGDVTASAERPPTWADLAGATMTRTPERFELRVRLNGSAPSAAPDDDRTMNIATFFELDGDDEIDAELWLNLADNGWGTGWWDAGGGRFADDTGVSTQVEGDEVVARFPLGHLDAASAFRWAVASEWGRYSVIGTPAAARDDCPDDGVTAFPATDPARPWVGWLHGQQARARNVPLPSPTQGQPRRLVPMG